jgi:hypothetical protein
MAIGDKTTLFFANRNIDEPVAEIAEYTFTQETDTWWRVSGPGTTYTCQTSPEAWIKTGFPFATYHDAALAGVIATRQQIEQLQAKLAAYEAMAREGE